MLTIMKQVESLNHTSRTEQNKFRYGASKQMCSKCPKSLVNPWAFAEPYSMQKEKVTDEGLWAG